MVYTSFKDCPKKLEYQFTPEFKLKLSDKCCYRMKKEPSKRYEKDSGRNIKILGLKANEGGMRAVHIGCVAFDGNKLKSFKPLNPVSNEFEEWFIKKYDIKLCKLYYPPFNFNRTGCRACPYALDLKEELNKLRELLPNEAKSSELIWKPVYDEYKKLGYRLLGEEKNE